MLRFENVSVSAGNEVILENINVSFKKGCLTSIIGSNGCGKTTLLQTLNGTGRVNGGKIYIENRDYLSIKPKERAKLLSFLPQVRSIIPSISTRTLVSHGRFPYIGFSRISSEDDKRIVKMSMEKAMISEYADQGVDTLSGGVRQRAFIAMQLAQDCDFLVADEPTTYLDIMSSGKILRLYRQLRDEGKTVILVLHDIAAALEISDEIVVMNDRKIVACGAPESDEISRALMDVFGVRRKRFSDEEGEYYILIQH